MHARTPRQRMHSVLFLKCVVLDVFFFVRLICREAVQGHGDAGRPARGGHRARAGAGSRGGGGEQRVGWARQPGGHVRPARGPTHLLRACRGLLARAAARRRRRVVAAHARLRRHGNSLLAI